MPLTTGGFFQRLALLPEAARANKIETMDEQMAYAMAEFGDYGECFVAEEPEALPLCLCHMHM